jgi:hypothetical protein
MYLISLVTYPMWMFLFLSRKIYNVVYYLVSIIPLAGSWVLD